MIEIPAYDRDNVYVFALNGDDQFDGLRQTFLSSMDEAAERPDPGDVAQLIGLETVDTRYIEVFPAKDVAELGLSRYLADALDVKAEALAGNRAKLDALEGYVMLVLSAAFKGGAHTLTPGPALTHIGTFPTEAAAAPAAEPLPDPGGTTMPAPEASERAPRARLGSGTIALVVLVALGVAALLVLVLPGATS
jgi:hypothetical protein